MTVASIVIDETGKEIDSIYIGRKIDQKEIKTQWVRENVIPVLGDYEQVETEEELLDCFWSFWMKYKEKTYCIADVPFPVESRLFLKCVETDRERRQWDAPYPLLDLSSMLYFAGIDPLKSRDQLSTKKGMGHNALDDVDTSVRIWKKLHEKD